MILSKQRLFARLYRKPAEEGGDAGEPAVDSSAGSGAIGTGNDDRVAMLARINDANDRANADELADVTDEGKTVPFVAPIDEEADPAIEATTEEEVPVVEETLPVAEPKKFKLKVNGKEIELTEEEVIARAQKVESADEYLALAKRAATPTETTPKPAAPTQEELRAAQELEDRAIVRAIQMGTEEEALAAIQKLTARQARPSITADDVSLVIDQRLVFNEAISQFRKDFADVANDPILNQLALQRDDALVEAGDRRPYGERYKQIGEELRAWKESLVPKPTAAVDDPVKDTSMADKKAKKDSAPKTPTAATAKVKQVVPEEEDGEEDPSIVIRNMQKQRGGPAWMRT